MNTRQTLSDRRYHPRAPIFIQVVTIFAVSLAAQAFASHNALEYRFADETCPASYHESSETGLLLYNSTVPPVQAQTCPPRPVDPVPDYTESEHTALMPFFRDCQPGFESGWFPQPLEIDQHLQQCQQARNALRLINTHQGDRFFITSLFYLANTISPEGAERRKKPVIRTVRPSSAEAMKDLVETARSLAEYGISITVLSHGNLLLDTHELHASFQPGEQLVLEIPPSEEVSLILHKELEITTRISRLHTWRILPFLSSSYDTLLKEREFVRVMKIMTLLAIYEDPELNLRLQPLWASRIRDMLNLERMYTINLPDLLAHSRRQIIALARQPGFLSPDGLRATRKRLQQNLKNPLQPADL